MQAAGNQGELPITVELQDMAHYSKLGIVGLAVLLVILFVGIMLVLIIKLRKESQAPVVHVPSENRLKAAKEKYNRLLMDLEARYKMGSVTKKEAYQELSKCIRHFVHSVTGIKVQNYTLEEIGRINMPNLYYLIAECYAPEFAQNASGDIGESIRKAREVIYGWN